MPLAASALVFSKADIDIFGAAIEGLFGADSGPDPGRGEMNSTGFPGLPGLTLALFTCRSNAPSIRLFFGKGVLLWVGAAEGSARCRCAPPKCKGFPAVSLERSAQCASTVRAATESGKLIRPIASSSSCPHIGTNAFLTRRPQSRLGRIRGRCRRDSAGRRVISGRCAGVVRSGSVI